MKALGQYFTTSVYLQETVSNYIRNNPDTILEPSVGRGHLVAYILSLNAQQEFDCFEIDPSIQPIVSNLSIQYVDFLETPIHKTYKTIIGNPPYKKKETKCIYKIYRKMCILAKTGRRINIYSSFGCI